MSPTHCLICYKTVKIPESSHSSDKTYLKSLQNVFILRKIFNLESGTLVKFLTKFPDINQWIKLCKGCSEKVEACQRLFKQLVEIKLKFERTRKEIVDNVKESCGGDKRRKGRRSKIDKEDVTEECRRLVVERDHDEATSSGDVLEETPNLPGLQWEPGRSKVDRKGFGGEVTEERRRLVMKGDEGTSSDVLEETRNPPELHRVVVKKEVTPEVIPQDDENEGYFEEEPVKLQKVDVDDDEWLPPEDNWTDHDQDDMELQQEDDLEEESRPPSVPPKKPRKCGPPKGTKFRPSMHCPFCKSFQCSMSHSEQLANHLDGKCAKRKNQKAEEVFLECPLCKTFKMSPVDLDKIWNFVEHTSTCFKPEDKARLSDAEIPRIYYCNLCTGAEAKFMKLDQFLQDYVKHHKKKYQCTLCPKRYSNAQTFKTHWSTDHPTDLQDNSVLYQCTSLLPQIPWWCPRCPLRFSEESSRDLHLETKHSPLDFPRKYPCPHCPNQYFTSEELGLHLGTAHILQEKLFQCSECSEIFSQESHLLYHRRSKHHLDLLHCPECTKPYLCPKQLSAHRQFAHGNPANLPKENYCPICQKPFATKTLLQGHKSRVHGAEDGVICPQCGKGFKNTHYLKSHLTYKHNSGPYPCTWPQCQKSFLTRNMLHYHLDKHRKTPQFKCSYCPKQYYFPGTLQGHEKIHENQDTKPFQCTQCPLRFVRQGYLTQHVRTRHNNPNWKPKYKKKEGKNDGKPKKKRIKNRKHECPKCNQVFTKWKDFCEHKKTHPFQMNCETCGKGFTTEAGYRVHRKVAHEKSFEWSCELCGKGMVSRSYLQAHLARAHGKGDYGMKRCEVEGCGKVFWQKARLEEHLRQHQGLPPEWKCKDCGREFVAKSGILKHWKKYGHEGGRRGRKKMEVKKEELTE